MKKNETKLYDINTQKEYFNSIVQLTEAYLNYIDKYKSLTKDYTKGLKKSQKEFEEKIQTTKIQLENDKNIDLNYIFTLMSSIPNINKSYIENLNFLIKGLDNSILSLQKFLDEKKYLIMKFLGYLNDSKNDLLIKINDIEKEKINYFNSLSRTENSISDFYKNKLKIENYSKDNNNLMNPNTTELKNLFIENNNLEEIMNKSINESKNIEKNYKSIIYYSKVFKKAYIDSSNITYENIKSTSYELIIEIKKFIQNIIILQKNCHAIPLKEIDVNLTKFLLKKEENEKILKDFFSKIDIQIEEEFDINSEKYSLKIFNKDNLNQKPFLTIEDGLDEINYMDNDLEFYTAKTMYDSFTLIEDKYKINFVEEEEKRNTKKLVSNLLLNHQKKYKKSEQKKIEKENNITNLKYIHENDLNYLYTLLDKHYNRVVFLQTISQFRTSGKYCMPIKVFEIIGNCLNIIFDTIIRDEDYHCAKNAIILSLTYFCIKDGKRFYLHNIIKDNKLFYNLEFWEKTLEVSIKKEIVKNKKNKNKNKINIIKNDEDNKDIIKNDKNEKVNDTKLEINYEKYNDISFGQIASIVNSMLDFNININDIRKIIEPKMNFYKLNEIHKKNIELIIDNKLNLNKNEENCENQNNSENINNNIMNNGEVNIENENNIIENNIDNNNNENENDDEHKIIKNNNINNNENNK